MGPPDAVGPRKKFGVSPPMCGPALMTYMKKKPFIFKIKRSNALRRY